jgi:hypothetical protein
MRPGLAQPGWPEGDNQVRTDRDRAPPGGSLAEFVVLSVAVIAMATRLSGRD